MEVRGPFIKIYGLVVLKRLTSNSVFREKRFTTPYPPTPLNFHFFPELWLWKLGQGHQNLNSSLLCPNYISMQTRKWWWWWWWGGWGGAHNYYANIANTCQPEIKKNNFNKRAKMALYRSQDGPVSLTWLPDKLAFRFRRRSAKKISKIAAMEPYWISDREDFSSFLSTSHPDASYQVWSQLAFRFRRRSEK